MAPPCKVGLNKEGTEVLCGETQPYHGNPSI